MVNYEHPNSKKVHRLDDKGIVKQYYGSTKCGLRICTDPRSMYYKWVPTNQEVTCKACSREKRIVFQVDENISVFGIDTDEKACLATIRARLLSALETWNNHASGKIDKARFNQDLRHDLRDTITDLHEYTHRYKTKRWCQERKRYVVARRPIRHNLDGKVISRE